MGAVASTPRPRTESVASVRNTKKIDAVACTMIGATAFDIMWRSGMRPWLEPTSASATIDTPMHSQTRPGPAPKGGGAGAQGPGLRPKRPTGAGSERGQRAGPKAAQKNS